MAEQDASNVTRMNDAPAPIAGAHGATQALLLQSLFSASAALFERDGVSVYAFDALYLVEMAEAKCQACVTAIDEGAHLKGTDFVFARAQAKGAIAMLRAVGQANTVEVRQIIALLDLVKEMADDLSEAGSPVH
jgi:hypothetical protein